MTTHDVVKISGATYRQLQWWDERGVIRPRHIGHMREWSEEDTLIVLIARRLRECEVSLQRARKILQRIARTNSTACEYVLTDGKQWVTGLDDPRQIALALALRKGPSFLIEIAKMRQEIQEFVTLRAA